MVKKNYFLFMYAACQFVYLPKHYPLALTADLFPGYILVILPWTLPLFLIIAISIMI